MTGGMQSIVDYQWLGNRVVDWGIALLVMVAAALILHVALRMFLRRFRQWASRTVTPLDDLAAAVIGETHFLFLTIMALYAGLLYLDLPPKLSRLADRAVVIAALFQSALWIHSIIGLWLQDYQKRHRTVDTAKATMGAVIGFVLHAALWSIAVLMILANLGINITALIASLGIGGVAVALALQTVLGDIFASLAIVLDRPFVVGDFIVVDDTAGTIEYIGLKTTRIRSLGGEQIVFSNAELLKHRIRNFKRMSERRIMFSVGLVYSTPAEVLERVPSMVRQIIEAQPTTRFDRAHFKEYGESALVFEVVYFVLDPDYNRYMDIQQSVNFAIFRRFNEERIEFAYPSRTLYVKQHASRASSSELPSQSLGRQKRI
jgi:small-conductance mechanosensitive channel